MPSLFNLISSNTFRQHLARGLLLVLTTNLIIGGVLLPYRAAHAIPVVIVGDPYGLMLIERAWYETAWEAMQAVWEKISAAYHATASWISAHVAAWTMADTWYMRALKYAFTLLKKKLLDMLVDDIVKWIQGGGKPKIVTDWKGFLGNAADQAGGQFVDKYLGLGLLCGKFAPQLRFILVKPPTFDTAVRCKLSEMGKNIGNFFNDFSQGGWKNWIDVTETQGNIYGVYLTMLDQKIGLESQAAESAKNEGAASSGFLGDKVCIKRQCTDYSPELPSGPQINPPENYPGTGGWKAEELTVNPYYKCECLQWETRTPGKIVADAASKVVVSKDIDWLISSKEFSEYIGAILDAVINQTVKKGLTFLTTKPSPEPPPLSGLPPVAINLSAYQDASQNGNSAVALVEQENLLKENLGKYLTEQQTNLGVLNQIKDAQNGSFTILSQMVSSGCSLPAGVSQTLLDTQTSNNCATACPCNVTTAETTKLTAPGVGEALVKKTTTQQKGETLSEPAGGTSCVLPAPPSSTPCTNPCISSSAATYQTLTSTTTAETEIAVLNAEIAATQSQLSKIDIAIADMGNYQKAASDYIAAYEALQRGSGSEATASSTEAVMWTAKNKAVASTQAILNTTETDLTMLLQKVQQVSQSLAQKNMDLQTKRGFSGSDCTYAQDGTYYKDLCNARAKQTELQNAYNTCLQQQQQQTGTGG